MNSDHDRSTILGTPFYPRTSVLNERQNWTAWDRYHIVDSYIDWRLELKTVRSAAAALDQSPLAKHYVTGPDAERFVDYLITRDATKLEVGQVYFTPWCNDAGVQVGDGIVMRLETDRFLFSADRMMRWFEYIEARRSVSQRPASMPTMSPGSRRDWSSPDTTTPQRQWIQPVVTFPHRRSTAQRHSS